MTQQTEEQQRDNEQPMTRRQTVEQERGRQAWENIREIKRELNKKEQQEYRSRVRGFNAMIQINGLGQTLGFLKAKGTPMNADFRLLGHLTHWMRAHFNRAIPDTNDGLLQWITAETTSSEDYRRATTECFAFGNWLRRFAEAELAEDTAKGTSNG